MFSLGLVYEAARARYYLGNIACIEWNVFLGQSARTNNSTFLSQECAQYICCATLKPMEPLQRQLLNCGHPQKSWLLATVSCVSSHKAWKSRESYGCTCRSQNALQLLLSLPQQGLLPKPFIPVTDEAWNNRDEYSLEKNLRSFTLVWLWEMAGTGRMWICIHYITCILYYREHIPTAVLLYSIIQ